MKYKLFADSFHSQFRLVYSIVMKHQVKGRKLNRSRKQRKALIKTLLGSLILREKITTTEAKAKEVRPLVDKIINKAKIIKADEKKRTAVIRDLVKSLPKEAVKKITGKFIEKFGERRSGYSRIIKLARRKSDGAKMAVIEIV